ncbi:MAG: hypothetical protein ACREOM_10060, partial [Candidatus Dormibacteraceae bacterium]
CDLLQLRHAAERVARPESALDPSFHADVQNLLDATSGGRFLPELDDLARSAQQSRGSAMQAANELRAWVLETRIGLAQFITRHSINKE